MSAYRLQHLTFSYFAYFFLQQNTTCEVSTKNNQLNICQAVKQSEVSEVSKVAQNGFKVTSETFSMSNQETIIQKIKTHSQRNGGIESVYQYIDKCYSWLNLIPMGEIYTIDEMYPDLNDSDFFTNILKLYIYETDTTISFLRNDFKQFRKNELLPLNLL
jgi:hypothetical protein